MWGIDGGEYLHGRGGAFSCVSSASAACVPRLMSILK